MPRFLVEVSHDPNTAACAHAIEVFLRTGSHFLTHAYWGCMDGEHKAWMTLELDSKREALNVVPADYRPHTKIVQLNAFTKGDVDTMHRKLGTQR